MKLRSFEFISVIAVTVVVVAFLVLAGCTGQTDNGAVSQNSATNNEGGSTVKKTLVVYYSATGSTQDVAKEIASRTDANLFEVVPNPNYTKDDLNYNNPDSRVCKEHDDASLRECALEQTTPDNFANYDTVYIGYPIWWGIAAWPLDTFIKSNDFTGKTIIPFCTSASSGLGESAKNLQAMNNTGTWLEGKRFQSGVSGAEIDEWIDSLQL